jgi:hypothetical protein
LPFYLQYYFAQHLGLFHLVTVPLRLLELLLERILRLNPLVMTPLNIVKQLKATFDTECALLRAANQMNSNEWQEVEAEQEVLQHLLDSDICILPSVLLMNHDHTSSEWSASTAAVTFCPCLR